MSNIHEYIKNGYGKDYINGEQVDVMDSEYIEDLYDEEFPPRKIKYDGKTPVCPWCGRFLEDDLYEYARDEDECVCGGRLIW